MEQEKQTSRVSRIEEFLLDPEKTIFELLEEFGNSVEEIRNALSQVDVANLETLKGEDGKTPERGVDYFTDEDLDNIEAFILDRIPVVGEDVPSPKQVNEYIDKQVAKIPRVKGDKGNPGTPGLPGKNGSPDSALDIIKKLRSLDKNQGLQLNDIRGLSKKIALLNEVSDEFTKLKEDLSNIKILTSGASSDGTGAVASVNGKVGVVVLTQDDIGNGTTYVRTENNFTDALFSKLTGLQTSYSFLNLTDTPSAYTGQAGKFVKVNATNDGLEFDSIPGGGDMLASVYDPTNVADDAFDMDNMVEGTNNKLVSAAEKSGWSGKQDALGFTPEDIANKSTNVTTDGASDTKYPSAKAVKDYADSLVAGLLDYRGGYDASSGNYPTTGGSGVAGAVMKGDMWIISVAGTLGGEAVQVGDSIIANTDTPGQTASNWNHLNGNISYVPENVANKENTTLDTSTSKYPTNRLVKEYADSKVEDNIVDGHTTIAPSGNAVFDALALKAPLASPTFTGTVETPAIKITTGASLGKVLTSDADGDATWETPSGGTSLWTAITGTRASNTTITVATDQTAIFKKGMIVRWQESGVDKVGMISIPSTYSSPNTTITIIGDTCASIDSNSFKYSSIIGAEQFIKNFAVAGNIGAVATDVANAYYATEPMRVIGADLQVGTAGTTNSTTIDINKAGNTMFTTKPTLATTVASSPTPFTADTATSLALGDRVSIDIDAVQTTNAIDLYVQLYLLPTRYLSLS